MNEPPALRVAPPPFPGVSVVRALRSTVSFYRYLYETVGCDWLWTKRRLASDAELRAILESPDVELHVLWVEGVPAGFAELDRRTRAVVDLSYFGLVPEFIGRGLGRWFLAKAVELAWAAKPGRVTVNTCDLDHPRALPNYKSAGFVAYDERPGYVTLVEGMKLPAHRKDAVVVP
jgi:GNAT superfamily N-acetyltransferase